MYETIAVIVFLLFALPALLVWLLRPRKDVTPGAFHNDFGPGPGDTHHGDGGSH